METQPGMVTESLPAGATEHTDLALARAVVARDRKAAAEFVNRYSGPVYQYARSRLMPKYGEAEDIVQEVFVAAWQHLPSYRGTSSLQSWLLGIARHKVEDYFRALIRREALLEDGGEEGMEDQVDASTLLPDAALDRERTAARTAVVLATLPDHYRVILLWRYWEKRSAREIAAQLGRTEKAVERLLARAREHFKRKWTDA